MKDNIKIFDLDFNEFDLSPKAVSLGNFDGVHKGHQKLMKENIKISKEKNLMPSVLLFKENTKNILNGEREYLTSLEDKIEILKNLGIECFCLLEFSDKFKDLSPYEFIEEILYIWGEPIDINDLGKIIFDAEKSEIRKAINEMVDDRNLKSSGLIIKKYEDKYQFATRPDHEKYISNIVKKSEKNLSNSSLETLSIIAYKQPITRAEIDKIRGVKSQSTIDSLLDKKLIKENGRLDKIGKPIIYVTTDLFLKYFNISNLDQLPKIDEKIDGEIDED